MIKRKTLLTLAIFLTLVGCSQKSKECNNGTPVIFNETEYSEGIIINCIGKK